MSPAIVLGPRSGSRVPPRGYVWVTAEEWNLRKHNPGGLVNYSDIEPSWRVRVPWNAGGWDNTPRLLLQETALDRGDKYISADSDPSLYRNFAGTETTPEAILAFANRSGNLWRGQVEGAPFAEWEYEIKTMRFLVEMWDAVLRGDSRGIIADNFRPESSTRPPRHPGWKWFTLPYAASLGDYSVYAPSSNLKSAGFGLDEGAATEGPSRMAVARRYVVQNVNSRVTALGSEVAIRERDSVNEITIAPASLLAELWMQFAFTIADLAEHRKCEACPRYFMLSPQENRVDRRYCSDACRSRALRARQKTARAMRAAGKSLHEIRKATGSDLPTLKEWLKPRGKK